MIKIFTTQGGVAIGGFNLKDLSQRVQRSRRGPGRWMSLFNKRGHWEKNQWVEEW